MIGIPLHHQLRRPARDPSARRLAPLAALLPLLLVSGCVTKKAIKEFSHSRSSDNRLTRLRRAQVLRSPRTPRADLRVNAELLDRRGEPVQLRSSDTRPAHSCRAVAISVEGPMPAPGDVALITSSAILYELELDGRLTGRTVTCHDAPPVDAIVLVSTGTGRNPGITPTLMTCRGGEPLSGRFRNPRAVSFCPTEPLERRPDGSLVVIAGSTSTAKCEETGHQCGLGCALLFCGGVFGALLVDAVIAAGYVAITCPELVVLILANT